MSGFPKHHVVCVGHASHDLIFVVPHHPSPDEKIFADEFLACGGGPAANAAVTVARLGFRSAFVGYLGEDVYGAAHCEELRNEGVDAGHVVRGGEATPLSVILVKPDGRRSLVNYKGRTRHLEVAEVNADFLVESAGVILFDGHEPRVSPALAETARRRGVPTVLDAGSLHAGTRDLLAYADHVVASEKFAAQWLGSNDPDSALDRLAEIAPSVVITLGERGLIWRRGLDCGSVPAPPIVAIDTTGAGDAFHGAFALAVALGWEWREVLRYASAAGALCCMRLGARLGIPDARQVQALLERWPSGGSGENPDVAEGGYAPPTLA